MHLNRHHAIKGYFSVEQEVISITNCMNYVMSCPKHCTSTFNLVYALMCWLPLSSMHGFLVGYPTRIFCSRIFWADFSHFSRIFRSDLSVNSATDKSHIVGYRTLCAQVQGSNWYTYWVLACKAYVARLLTASLHYTLYTQEDVLNSSDLLAHKTNGEAIFKVVVKHG